MDEPALPSRVAPGRSCVACRRRKIKCDREQPCGYCTKQRFQCIYPGTNQEARNQSETDLLSRLGRIELSLQRLESRMTNTGITSSPSALHLPADAREDANAETQPASDPGSGKLVLEEGDTRYVTSSFWADLDEVDRDEAARLDQPTTVPDSVPYNNSIGSERYQDFLFAFYPTSVDLRQLHPEEGHIFTLWQVFLENVDPVFKLVHVPITQCLILRASQNPAGIPPVFESLMFSIYYAAVTSMQCTASCETLLQEERPPLLGRYRFGVEQALAKANFMSAPDVPTLQALTLYLTCARQSADKTYIWSMTGLLIRLAMKLGLHRDPAALGLPPFMSEMRRRLWWQILTLDIRTAEDNDMDPFICEHTFDTRLPAYVNDVDLDINMADHPTAGSNYTEMLFTLTRFEISHTARKLVFSPSFAAHSGHPSLNLQEKIDLIDSLQRELEEKYFQGCDNKIPICSLAITATRMVLAKIKLTISHPTRNGSSGIFQNRLRDLVVSSIEIIEYAQTLRSSDKYSRWVWLFQEYIEWDAVAFLLHSMSAVSLPTLSERAWKAVDTFFNQWKGHVRDGDRRWRRLESLRMKAAAKQKQRSTSNNDDHVQPITPAFEQNLSRTAMSMPTASEEASRTIDFGVQLNKETEGQSTFLGTNVTGVTNQAPTGDYDEWNFDNIPYIRQGAPTWEMDLSEDAFNSWL